MMKNTTTKNSRGFFLMEILLWSFVLILVSYSIMDFYFLTKRIKSDNTINVMAEINYFIEKDLSDKESFIVDEANQTITIRRESEDIMYQSTSQGFFRGGRKITDYELKITDFCLQLKDIKKCYYPISSSLQAPIVDNDKKEPPPTAPPTVSESKTVKISGGNGYFLALKDDGNVYAWDTSGSGELIAGLSDKEIVQVASGDSHCLALTKSGDVYAWGDNSSGQLGLGNTVTKHSPELINTLENEDIVLVAGGSKYSLALTKNGDVYAWGDNSSGQLGLGHTKSVYTPQLVTGLIVEPLMTKSHEIPLQCS